MYFYHPASQIRRYFRKHKILGSLAISSYLIAAVTSANELAYLNVSENLFLEEMPLVLSASRLTQPRSEAPASITIIDRDMIEASGITSLPEVFRLVPGFQVGHSHTSLLTPRPVAVTYLGMNDEFSRRMQVLIDGRAVYNPIHGGIRWDSLPVEIEDIERIEVVRGPNAASYGSNSFMGVINIITGSGITSKNIYASASASDIHYQKNIIKLSEHFNKLDLNMTISRHINDGFETLSDKLIRDSAVIHSNFQATNSDDLSLHLGFSETTHGLGMKPLGNFGDGVDDPFRDGDTANSFQKINWNHQLSSGDEIKIQLHQENYKFDDTYLADLQFGFTFTTLINNVESKRQDFEIQYLRNYSDSWRWMLGYEKRLDRVSGATWFSMSSEYENHLSRIFATSEWKPYTRLNINTGLMYEDSDIADSGFSPKLSANYQLNKQNTIRSSFSMALRSPTMFEEYNSGRVFNVGNTGIDFYVYSPNNTDLKPEIIKSLDIGWLYESADHTLSMDTKLAFMQLSDFITYPNNYSSTYTINDPRGEIINLGEVDFTSAELELRYRISASTQLYFTQALSKASGEAADEVLTSGYNMLNLEQATPASTTSLLVSHRFSNQLNLGIFYYHVSKMFWYGFASNNEPVDEFDILNISLSKTIKLSHKNLLLTLTGNNLLGEYNDLTNKLAVNKRYMLTVAIEF